MPRRSELEDLARSHRDVPGTRHDSVSFSRPPGECPRVAQVCHAAAQGEVSTTWYTSWTMRQDVMGSTVHERARGPAASARRGPSNSTDMTPTTPSRRPRSRRMPPRPRKVTWSGPPRAVEPDSARGSASWGGAQMGPAVTRCSSTPPRQRAPAACSRVVTCSARPPRRRAALAAPCDGRPAHPEHGQGDARRGGAQASGDHGQVGRCPAGGSVSRARPTSASSCSHQPRSPCTPAGDDVWLVAWAPQAAPGAAGLKTVGDDGGSGARASGRVMAVLRCVRGPRAGVLGGAGGSRTVAGERTHAARTLSPTTATSAGDDKLPDQLKTSWTRTLTSLVKRWSPPARTRCRR